MEPNYSTDRHKTGHPPRVGVTEPTRPRPVVYAAVDLPRLPPDRGPRIAMRHFHVPDDTLPNGRPRPDYIRAEAAFNVGGDYHLLARIQHKAGVTHLELREGHDLVRDRPDLLATPELAASLFWAMAAQYTRVRGRCHAREARN